MMATTKAEVAPLIALDASESLAPTTADHPKSTFEIKHRSNIVLAPCSNDFNGDEVLPLLLSESSGGYHSKKDGNNNNTQLLLQIRWLYFLFHACLSSVTPFTTLYLSKQAPHIDSVGLGILHAIHPISCLFTSPLWGFVADHQSMGRNGTDRALRTLLLTYFVSACTRLIIPFTLHSFSLLALVKGISSIFYGPVKSLMDSSVLHVLGDRKQQFGRFRVWGQVGCGVSSSLMLKAIHNNPWGYNLIFIVHAGLLVPTLVAIYSLVGMDTTPGGGTLRTKLSSEEDDEDDDRDKKRDGVEEKNATIRDMLPVIARDGRILQVFFLVAVKGLASGFMETFVYMHIRQTYAAAAALTTTSSLEGGNDTLGNDLMLCRIMLSVGCMLSFWYAADLNRYIGSPALVLLASTICTGGVLLLYSAINAESSGYQRRCNMFLAEFLRGLAGSLFNSTVVVYLHGIAPPNMKSTMLIFKSEFIYQGIGITSGSYIGGRLISSLGMSNAFHCLGQIILSIIFVAFISRKYLLANYQISLS